MRINLLSSVISPSGSAASAWVFCFMNHLIYKMNSCGGGQWQCFVYDRTNMMVSPFAFHTRSNQLKWNLCALIGKGQRANNNQHLFGQRGARYRSAGTQNTIRWRWLYLVVRWMANGAMMQHPTEPKIVYYDYTYRQRFLFFVWINEVGVLLLRSDRRDDVVRCGKKLKHVCERMCYWVWFLKFKVDICSMRCDAMGDRKRTWRGVFGAIYNGDDCDRCSVGQRSWHYDQFYKRNTFWHSFYRINCDIVNSISSRRHFVWHAQ